MGIGAIIGLILIAVLIILLTTGGGKALEDMKDYVGRLAGIQLKKQSALCPSFQTIRSKKNLTDLIVLASLGECGGDTTETAFKFNLTPSPYTIKFKTDTPSDELCGTHTYENVTGLQNYTSIAFGDIEYYESNDCNYNGEPSWQLWETQDCISDNKNDLVIVTPKNWMQDPCTSHVPSSSYIGCMHEANTLTSHLSEFGLDPIQNSPLYTLTGTWAIKKAGEDTVICYIG